MKEDILEQMVDEYLQHKGYFTRHNIKFRPAGDHVEYDTRQDAVHSDIDVIGIHPPRWPPQTAPLVAGQTAPGRTVEL